MSDCWDRVHPGPWLRPTASHECSSSCPFIVHFTAYVCPFSNAVHHCTEFTCDYAVEDGSARVCPITANSYPLRYMYTFEQVGHLDKQRKRDINTMTDHSHMKPKRDHLAIRSSPSPRSSASESSPTAAAAAGAVDQQFSPSPSPSSQSSGGGSSSSSSRGKKGKSDYSLIPLSRLFSINASINLRDEVSIQIANFIERFVASPMPYAARAELASEIFDVFQRILSTPIELPSTFSVIAATFTCLYAFTRPSLGMGPVVFIRYHDSLVLRPLMECVTQVLRKPFRSHTQWTSLLNSCMISYCRRVMPVINFA